MVNIAGTPQPKVKSSQESAWLGGNYRTIRLANDVEAVRVHAGGRLVSTPNARELQQPAGAMSNALLAKGSGSKGRWFAVGDVILTRSEYASSRALPHGFSHVDWCRLRAGSIVNIGQCSPLFGGAGGGEQVEWLSGPAPEQITTLGSWSDRSGSG